MRMSTLRQYSSHLPEKNGVIEVDNTSEKGTDCQRETQVQGQKKRGTSNMYIAQDEETPAGGDYRLVDFKAQGVQKWIPGRR